MRARGLRRRYGHSTDANVRHIRVAPVVLDRRFRRTRTVVERAGSARTKTFCGAPPRKGDTDVHAIESMRLSARYFPGGISETTLAEVCPDCLKAAGLTLA
jgi:hypothetical protein